MSKANGVFEVKLTPLPPIEPTAEGAGDIPLARLSLDKQFHGDLEGASKGQMFVAGTSVKGSAGYVALEQVVGTMQGRAGSFVLQHNGTMTRGVPQLSVTVVPDSGTGELTGLEGRLEIEIVDGKHLYHFEYSIAE